jgi:hypothetical protein
MKIEISGDSETSEITHHTTRCHDPQERNLNLHCRENVKSCASNKIIYRHEYENGLLSLKRQISEKTEDTEAKGNEEHSTGSESPSCSMKELSNLSRQSNSSLLTPAEAVKVNSSDVTASSTARDMYVLITVPSHLTISQRFHFIFWNHDWLVAKKRDLDAL